MFMTDSRFIGEPLEVAYDHPPLLEKRPGCPDRFTWGAEIFEITEKLAEWHDYRRRGRMAMNMQDAHLERAAQRGSWGVGRDFYRVRTESGRVFELYYDRAPKSADERKGGWFLYREILSDPGEPEAH